MEEYPMARKFRDTRINTIGGGTTEIMKEIISKIIIDDLDFKALDPNQEVNNEACDSPRQESAKIDETPSPENQTFKIPDNCEEYFLGLPQRFKKEKAKDFDGTFHFNIAGDKGGEFTVVVGQGACDVQKGLNGSADCIIKVKDKTFLGVELGKINVQTAFMTGKIKVSKIGMMMKFTQMFKKIKV